MTRISCFEQDWNCIPQS